MKQTKKSRLAKWAAAGFWLAVWQAVAMAVGQEVFLVSPVQALRCLLRLLPQADFWHRVEFSAGRILLGFGLGVVCSAALAVAAEICPAAEVLIAPVLQLVKATPVASFIILALVWVRGSSLSVLISFLMVLPVLYGAVRTGIRAADPQLLEMKLEWKKKGKDIMKKDRIDRLCKARDMAYLFCFLCIVSMIMFPINQVLGIRLPEKFIQIWRLVITISPFPALLLGAVAAGKARWQVPDLNRILPDSGKPFMKKERDRGKLYERVCFLNQIGLTSLVLIPLNKALGIQLPLWVTGGWMAVIAGLAIAVMVLKNRG